MHPSGRIGQNEWNFQIRPPVESGPSIGPSGPSKGGTIVVNTLSGAKKSEIAPQTQECIPRSKIASSMRSLFAFEYFNKMQSTCLPALYETAHNCVIGAPTAAGKTICFELALAATFEKKSLPTFPKALYLAPLKSLVQERLVDWKMKLGKLGIKCQELSGDRDDEILGENDLFLATPEKWDAITRKWSEYKQTISKISLILIDEVHLLGDDRGAILEAIITRMLILMKDQSPRIIALSASSPNVSDIGHWIGAPKHCIFYFGEDHRPITPQLQVIGYPSSKNDYLFERALDFKLWGVIAQYSDKKPTLVFCSSRKSASVSASKLLELGSQNGRSYVTSIEQKERLYEAAKKVSDDPQLAACLMSGVAYHHAGMSIENRSLVEKLFATGEDVMVVASTSTLAVGVNLPAYLVVIKSTSYWTQANGIEEYSPLVMRQMIGRAGRPQFGTSAVAVIMTQQSKTSTYESILESDVAATESKLHKHLKDVFLSEIALGSISSIKDALTYLQRSYLAVRVYKNASHYVPSASDQKPDQKTIQKENSQNAALSPFPVPVEAILPLHPLLRSLGIAALGSLMKFECISGDNQSISVSSLGRSVSRSFVSTNAIQDFFLIFAPPSSESTEDKPDYSSMEGITTRMILECISSSPQFSDIIVRRAEKKELKEFSSISRFPISKGIQRKEKVMILLQSHFSRPFSDRSLKDEAESCRMTAISLCSCLVQFFLQRGWFYATHRAILLLKCFRKLVWTHGGAQTSQIPLITKEMALDLEKQGCRTLMDLERVDQSFLQRVLSKPAAFAQNVIQRLSQIPSFALAVKVTQHEQKEGVKRLNFEAQPSQGSKPDHRWLLLGQNGTIIAHQLLTMSAKYQESLIFSVEVTTPTNSKIDIVLSSDEWIGIDIVGSISLNSIGYQHLLQLQDAQDPYNDPGTTSSKKRKRSLAPSHGPFDPIEPLSEGVSTPKKPYHPQKREKRGEEACEHKCKNKFTCKHDCCKQHPDIRASGIVQLDIPRETHHGSGLGLSTSIERAKVGNTIPNQISSSMPPSSQTHKSQTPKKSNDWSRQSYDTPHAAAVSYEPAYPPFSAPPLHLHSKPDVVRSDLTAMTPKTVIVVSKPGGRINVLERKEEPNKISNNLPIPPRQPPLQAIPPVVQAQAAPRLPIPQVQLEPTSVWPQMTRKAPTAFKMPSLIPGSRPVAEFAKKVAEDSQRNASVSDTNPKPDSYSFGTFPSLPTHSLAHPQPQRAIQVGITEQPFKPIQTPRLPATASISKISSNSGPTIAQRGPQTPRATIPYAVAAATSQQPMGPKRSVNGWNALLDWELHSEP